MPQGPRERLITAAIGLVRERGVEGTGVADLVERSNSARRSIYQHFPGGKLELIDASTRAAGEWVRRLISGAADSMSGAELLAEVGRQMSANLTASDFRLGCPIGAAASAPPDAVAVHAAAGAAFDSWIDEIAAPLVRDGLPAAEARSLAGFAVSSIQGALLRARASRSTEPIDEAVAQLTRLLDRP